MLYATAQNSSKLMSTMENKLSEMVDSKGCEGTRPRGRGYAIKTNATFLPSAAAASIVHIFLSAITARAHRHRHRHRPLRFELFGTSLRRAGE
jgi:hypothetical protein